jgi:hypothetical protein
MDGRVDDLNTVATPAMTNGCDDHTSDDCITVVKALPSL